MSVKSSQWQVPSPGVHVTIPGQSTFVKAVAKIATNSALQALTEFTVIVVTVAVVAADLRVGGGDQHPGVKDHVADVARAGRDRSKHSVSDIVTGILYKSKLTRVLCRVQLCRAHLF